MAYSSTLYVGEHQIDVDKVIDVGDPEVFAPLSTKQPHGVYSTGWEDEEGVHRPFSVAASGRLPSEYRVAEADIEPMIKDMEKYGANISARLLRGSGRKKVPCKDQDGTFYCWINAPTMCSETVRVYANDEYVSLSPGSCGGPITGFRNVGGWGSNGLKRMISHGNAPSSVYPDNQVRKPSNFDAAMLEAARFKVLEWWSLEDLIDVVSCLLRGWPVGVGLNWWRHEVMYTDALWLDGELAIRFRNSWGMSYGSDGFSILRGRKMHPDDAVTPRVVMPSSREKYATHGALAIAS